MRIITLNMNGIRSAARKGFYAWLRRQRADVVCLQEVRAWQTQIADRVFHPPAYQGYFYDADRKGYSGVALYTRKPPTRVTRGLGWADFDAEARYLQADFDGVSVVSVYIPSGSSGEVRQDFKFDILERLKPVLQGLRRRRREFVLCGDFNIAHRPIDLKNWRSNQKNSGFLPEERAWLDWLYDDAGYIDVFRQLEPRAEQYSWWSNRGRAWDNNVGWRLDLQVATPGFAGKAVAASIYKRRRFSDHAPVIIDYDHEF